MSHGGFKLMGYFSSADGKKQEHSANPKSVHSIYLSGMKLKWKYSQINRIHDQWNCIKINVKESF